MGRLLRSPRDRVFAIGTALIIVQTANNPRDAIAGLVVLAFWLVLWVLWYDKDTDRRVSRWFSPRPLAMPARGSGAPWIRVLLSVGAIYALAYWSVGAGQWALAGTLSAGYIAPSYVAVLRERARVAPVFLVNLFFGWTVIGWIVAVIWATTGETRAERAAVVGRASGT